MSLYFKKSEQLSYAVGLLHQLAPRRQQCTCKGNTVQSLTKIMAHVKNHNRCKYMVFSVLGGLGLGSATVFPIHS